MGSLLDEALSSLQSRFEVHHSMVLMLDGSGKRLYTVASRGYPQSGVGSEVAVGCGVIGASAEQRTPIRITHTSAEYSYGRAIRDSLEREGLGAQLETAIPFPGLPDSRSQLAAPIMAAGRLLGVLYVESPEDLRFSYDDEDAMVVLAAQLGTAFQRLEQAAEPQQAEFSPAAASAPPGTPSVIRHYASDDSVFIDEDYLIKGVAGAIINKLLGDHLRDGRTEFTNRELRLDPALGLPEIADNLEARLVLLERRLTDRGAPIRIEKVGRGRFRLRVARPLKLTEVG
jgi:adenylate cyclase